MWGVVDTAHTYTASDAPNRDLIKSPAFPPRVLTHLARPRMERPSADEILPGGQFIVAGQQGQHKVTGNVSPSGSDASRRSSRRYVPCTVIYIILPFETVKGSAAVLTTSMCRVHQVYNVDPHQPENRIRGWGHCRPAALLGHEGHKHRKHAPITLVRRGRRRRGFTAGCLQSSSAEATI